MTPVVKENSWTLLYEPRDTPVALTHPMSTPYSSCAIQNTLFYSMKTEPAFKRYTSVTHQCLAVLTFNLIWPNGDPHGSLRIKTNCTEIMSGFAYWLFCALEICRVTERHWIEITFALKRRFWSPSNQPKDREKRRILYHRFSCKIWRLSLSLSAES
jgi:hypothetical protein